METLITGIIPSSYFMDLEKPNGSAYLRSEAIANNAADFKIWEHGKLYDQLIFQKAYWPEMMLNFSGPKILDLCDPDWVDGDVDIVHLGSLVHAITCSSKALTDLVAQYFPNKTFHVPDRLDLIKLPAARPLHEFQAKEAVWFGFIKNAYETLPPLAEMIRNNKLNLTIISDAPYLQDDSIKALKPRYVQFNHDSAYTFIKDADIVLNPRSEKVKFKYKSNNKSIISWWLGLPVVEKSEDIELLMSPVERNNQVRILRPIVKAKYDINDSIKQYREIFSMIKRKHY